MASGPAHQGKGRVDDQTLFFFPECVVSTNDAFETTPSPSCAREAVPTRVPRVSRTRRRPPPRRLSAPPARSRRRRARPVRTRARRRTRPRRGRGRRRRRRRRPGATRDASSKTFSVSFSVGDDERRERGVNARTPAHVPYSNPPPSCRASGITVWTGLASEPRHCVGGATRASAARVARKSYMSASPFAPPTTHRFGSRHGSDTRPFEFEFNATRGATRNSPPVTKRTRSSRAIRWPNRPTRTTKPRAADRFAPRRDRGRGPPRAVSSPASPRAPERARSRSRQSARSSPRSSNARPEPDPSPRAARRGCARSRATAGRFLLKNRRRILRRFRRRRRRRR